MTNKQAIKIIQNEYKCVDCDCDIERSCGKCQYMMPNKEPILTAYEMAIQALSQEPTSRVKNELNVELNELEPCTDAVSRELSAKDYLDMADRKAKKIKDALTVTQKSGKWISVSERLPEDAYGCLVTVYDTDLRTQDEFENILPYFVGYDGETWNNADGEPIPFEVVAWMPLPKPYELQESEDKE